VADWARSALQQSRCRDLIELGPGDGSLAAAVFRSMPILTRLRTRLHLVETSASLRARQHERLGSRVRWHESLHDALTACGGRACIYSNEFFDAFPVRRFRRLDGEWQESWIEPEGECWQAVTELPDSSIWSQPWPDGQIVEVHEAVRHWLSENLQSWSRGRMLTIDYGQEMADLHHRRPAGSLRGYFHHQLVEGPECYRRAGHQDLTADINFTDLKHWSEPWARTLRLESQRSFLGRRSSSHAAVDAFVADPLGAGAAFRVWECEAHP
jgi:SAM-dependent MidA family methyltransferase